MTTIPRHFDMLHGASCSERSVIYPSVSQSLEELEFERSLWDASRKGNYALVSSLLSRGKVSILYLM